MMRNILVVLGAFVLWTTTGCGGSTPATRVGEPGPWEVQVISMGDTTNVPTVDGERPSAEVSGVLAGEPGEWFTETSVDGYSAPETPAAPVRQAPVVSAPAAEAPAAKKAETTMSDFTFGFRIQISANEGSMILAEQRASEADSLYAIPAYVEYEKGWYKVRLGDFLTREDAQSYLRSSDIGERYDKAFVAATYVLKP